MSNLDLGPGLPCTQSKSSRFSSYYLKRIQAWHIQLWTMKCKDIFKFGVFLVLFKEALIENPAWFLCEIPADENVSMIYKIFLNFHFFFPMVKRVSQVFNFDEISKIYQHTTGTGLVKIIMIMLSHIFKEFDHSLF